MDRRTAIKVMMGGGMAIGGCEEQRDRIMSFNEKLDLMDYLRIVETGDPGDYPESRSYAIGKNGELGPLQITKQYVDDCNRIIKKEEFDYEMRTQMSICRAMVLIYWDHYATPERLGREPRMEDLARIHNGGPEGWKKASTESYWYRVKMVMDRKEHEDGKSNAKAS